MNGRKAAQSCRSYYTSHRRRKIILRWEDREAFLLAHDRSFKNNGQIFSKCARMTIDSFGIGL